MIWTLASDSIGDAGTPHPMGIIRARESKPDTHMHTHTLQYASLLKTKQKKTFGACCETENEIKRNAQSNRSFKRLLQFRQTSFTTSLNDGHLFLLNSVYPYPYLTYSCMRPHISTYSNLILHIPKYSHIHPYSYTVANATQTLRKRTANASQKPLKRTSNALQTHFKHTANALETHRKHLANAHQTHRKSTAKAPISLATQTPYKRNANAL